MPLKTLFISFSFLLLAINNSAKEATNNYQPEKVVAGRITNTGQPVIALQYSFPYGVVAIESDSNNNLILVVRKVLKNRYANKGTLFSMHPTTGSVHWHKDIRRFHIRFTQDLILYHADDGTKIINKHSGKFLHSTPYEIKFIHYADNYGLTFNGSYFDLQTNKEIWKQKVRFDQGWAQLEKFNDSGLLIASNGLYMMKLSNGEGWKYKMTTSKEDYSSAIAAGAAIIVLAAVGAGAGVVPVVHEDYISGLSSNMLIDTEANAIYYSALKSTVALDNNGREIWTSEMRPKETSKSYLWLEGETLLHINLGYAFLNEQLSRQGTAFFAGYNKKTVVSSLKM